MHVVLNDIVDIQYIKPKVEYIMDETKQPISTTTFIVSSSDPSPDDLCFSVTINNEQVINFDRKASRRYICQVFYHREGVNWWKATLAFCPEHLLDVSSYQTDSKLNTVANWCQHID